jgi:hypothetical protein
VKRAPSFFRRLPLAVVLLLGACAHQPRHHQSLDVDAEPYQPANAEGIELLPQSVRRVVLLPIWSDEGEADYLDHLDRTLLRELSATLRFEVVTVDRDSLYARFHKRQLSPVEPLPPELFDALIERYDADAVIFPELTAFEPYKPLSLGLRLRLVDLQNGATLWAFDHYFNAGDPRVAAGAKQFYSLRQHQPFPLDGAYGTLQSPRRFAAYCAAMAFLTLPPRQIDPLSGNAPAGRE